MSGSLRRMLFALAARLMSAAVVAVRGGLGGARDGGGGTRLGCCAVAAGSSSFSVDEASASVGSGVIADLLFSTPSRE